jgi:hypothetical protein
MNAVLDRPSVEVGELPPGLTFDEATHTYRYRGAVVPGVTSVLRPLMNFDFVDPDVLAANAAFGTAVHKACELDDLGQLDEAALDPALAPYLAGWRKFSRDYRVIWSAIEKKVFHPQLRYAGALDRYGMVLTMPTENGRHVPAMVDIKSGSALYPSVGPQLAAYHRALNEASVTTRRLAVQLKPDGTYFAKWHEDPNDFAVFCSLLTLTNWCAKHSITPSFSKERV